jgi:hypothetical protein
MLDLDVMLGNRQEPHRDVAPERGDQHGDQHDGDDQTQSDGRR